MYAKINTKGNNKGSSRQLANYLDKEVKNDWYSHKSGGIDTENVINEIDKNGKGQLGKEDWKFTEISYNPSQAEQQHLVIKVTGKEVTSFNQLTSAEQEQVKTEFANLVRDYQDIQAKQYQRGLTGGEDLKYYFKIETQRRYKGYDNEVKEGKAKQGALKKGLNLHAHIVQSRKAVDKKTKLSPQSTHKAPSKQRQGFNRNEFKNKLEQQFDIKHNYERSYTERFDYINAMKQGRYIEAQRIIKDNQLKQLNHKISEHQSVTTAIHQSAAEKKSNTSDLSKGNEKKAQRGPRR